MILFNEKDSFEANRKMFLPVQSLAPQWTSSPSLSFLDWQINSSPSPPWSNFKESTWANGGDDRVPNWKQLRLHWSETRVVNSAEVKFETLESLQGRETEKICSPLEQEFVKQCEWKHYLVFLLIWVGLVLLVIKDKPLNWKVDLGVTKGNMKVEYVAVI